jgi:hypothetical protein
MPSMKPFLLALCCVLLVACGPPPLRQVDSSAEYIPVNTPEKAQEIIRKHAR